MEALIGREAYDRLVRDAPPRGSLWELAVRRRLASDHELLRVLSTRFRLKLADLSQSERRAREIVPEAMARRYHILPLQVTDSYLEIATAGPFDLDCEKALAFATGREVRVALASPHAIREKLEELYRPDQVIGRILERMEPDTEVRQLETDAAEVEQPVSVEEASRRSVVRLVDLILSKGILARSSDIHVEPAEGGVVVRYRIDGVLRRAMTLPRSVGLPLISRIKILSGLDIADRLRPQDGRARVAVNGLPVDLRISTLPASVGEKVVVRVLDSARTVLALDGLGLNPDEVAAIKALLAQRDGIVLLTGPTGSGKTTTLYSAIMHVQSEGVNIVTVEDPVEYRLRGIVQVQVHEKAGLTFAAALRSILRQDPDVVLVGEIRDKETAQIAVQASLTGHLVLSTLHTNDAANAVTRLVDIGIEAFKIAGALRGVVAQRLMRRLCPACRAARTEPLPVKLRAWIAAGTPLFRAVGCAECAMTGYRGRFSIVEVLRVTPALERRIGAGENAERLAQAARRSGMRSLWESGLAHVLRGETSVEELLRAVDLPQEDDAVPPPLRPAIRVRARGARARTAVAERMESPGPPAGGRPVVLLVDDEDHLRQVMRDLLERDGYVVLEAADGGAALEQADRGAPDIIVLDLRLPGLDGYEVLSRLRSNPTTAAIPVIVLTALGDEESEVRVFELGADDFLAKPFRARALSARLRAVLGRRVWAT